MFGAGDYCDFQVFNGPGGLIGQQQVTCPGSGEELMVPVATPDGTDSYECPSCKSVFDVNWWLSN